LATPKNPALRLGFLFSAFPFAAKHKRELTSQLSHHKLNLKHATIVPHKELGKLF